MTERNEPGPCLACVEKGKRVSWDPSSAWLQCLYCGEELCLRHMETAHEPCSSRGQAPISPLENDRG